MAEDIWNVFISNRNSNEPGKMSLLEIGVGPKPEKLVSVNPAPSYHNTNHPAWRAMVGILIHTEVA